MIFKDNSYSQQKEPAESDELNSLNLAALNIKFRF